jgi:hypothetical protein
MNDIQQIDGQENRQEERNGNTGGVGDSESSKDLWELGTAEALFFPTNREKFGSVCTHDRCFPP